ncbi:MAG: wax ester/triacylglycerol synthase family O-acyltransferase [Halioglobus sp.]|nr:wax ester/triacylglycerol synthase family O-acyltransferase [Halioglobus sp.]
MKQLTGLDASFLYMETANAPMHISGLSIYDQSTAPGGLVRFKDIVKNTNNRLMGLPVMTQKLVNVPMNLDHPYWVTDGAYDPEFHIRHIALPKPGDWRQLCILISRLHARPLDRAHPLWELYIIEGLNNVEGVPKDSFAMFSKTHHAAIDGTSGMELTAATHDLTPDYKRAHNPATISIDSEPSSIELLLRSQLNNIRKPFNMVSVARNTVPGIARTVAGLSNGKLSRVTNIPRTRFNNSVSPHRVFDAITVRLDDVKTIKNSVPGATVNDAAITIVGGALRKYLQAHDELPAQSLAAMAPVNVRSDKDKAGGNIVATMTVQVRSDIEDPLKRLAAVHDSTSKAKELTNAIGAKTMTDYTQFIPATLTAQAARLSSRWGLMNRMSPQFNCVITNVPGPPIPLYNTGAKMVANFGTGPVQDGLGLFHVIGSYCGQFVVSATCCRAIMPDPNFYRQCLQDSFDELLAATTKPKTVKKSKPKKARRARVKSAA